MRGQETDKFLLKVQEAAAGYPWYSHDKLQVNILLFMSLAVSAFCHAQLCYSPHRHRSVSVRLSICLSVRPSVTLAVPHLRIKIGANITTDGD